MRKVLTSLLLVVLCYPLTAQISILFVNDNDAFSYETDTMLNAMSRTSYTFDYFNAVDSADAPSASWMAGYDLVVWYCGVDGSGLQFWDGIDGDDPEVDSFLDNGGSLWVMGTDLLYDRYGTAGPTSFLAGDQVYDHCGIVSYDAQSYADDGTMGCPQLDLNTTLPLVGPDSLTWIFPTTWYIDAVTPTASAEGVYEMGPAGYSLATGISGLYNVDATSGSRVMSYLFNPAEIGGAGDVKADFLERHLDFWNGVITSTASPMQANALTAWPNPTQGMLHLSAEIDYQLMDATGRCVRQGRGSSVSLEGMPSGIYILKGHEGSSMRIIRQ